MRLALAALIGLSLAGPASAQSVGQMLQGLTTGNQSQDDALRQAYERGYRNGQQDAARNTRPAARDSSYDRNRRDDRDAPSSSYRDR
jgi:hypothetical protein